ncbi:hypothetical protein GCM10023165_21670 [Variovorax defluvii]|uniref:Uncharacterized protein n=1 Tax=Variovorax defluvii TaxID=913761 RepID=A0ABP8HLZ2_9BURK
MDVLIVSELMTGMLAIIGTGLLFMLATSRAPKALHDEIALRVERSIAAIHACEDRHTR